MANEGIDLKQFQTTSNTRGAPSLFKNDGSRAFPMNQISPNTDLIALFPGGLNTQEAQKAAFEKMQAMGI